MVSLGGIDCGAHPRANHQGYLQVTSINRTNQIRAKEYMMKFRSRRRSVLVSLASLLALFSMLVAPQTAHASYWLVEKVGCFELLYNGTFYRLTNVCAGPNPNTGLYTTITMGGNRASWCIGQHQYVHLGTLSEFSWARDSSWPSGCARQSAPYPLSLIHI